MFKKFSLKYSTPIVALFLFCGLTFVMAPLLYAETEPVEGGSSQKQTPILCSISKALPESFNQCYDGTPFFNGTLLVISPDNPGGDVVIYTASSEPTKEGQWKGHLYKYILSSGIMPASPEWDAGIKLDSQPYSDRDVFTTNWKDGNWRINFNSSINNSSTLAQMLEPNVNYLPFEQVPKFIRWVLGSDEWHETNENERYKLGDIYHSGLVKVCAPKGWYIDTKYNEFKKKNAKREKLIYVQANDGMLHAFNCNTGQEKWAFIPPNVLAEGRIVGMKQDLSGKEPKWEEGDTSHSRYLLDGPLVAEDVLFSDGKYHTIILGLLGYAGAGLYVLDVTDPNEPQFMWAVENAIYTRAGDSLLPNLGRYVSYWVRNGNTVSRMDQMHNEITDNSDLNYKDMRFTKSTPAIGYVSAQKGSQTDTWVAIMGNGSMMKRGDDSSLAGVYIINIENGRLLKVLSIPSAQEIATPVAMLCKAYTRLAKYFYVGGNNGVIYEGDLRAKTPGQWTIKNVFDIKSSSKSFYTLDVAYINRDKWLFALTGDGEDLIGDEATTNYMIAANISEGSSSIDDLTELSSETGNADSRGWYIRLDMNEYPATSTTYYKGHIFFSTYLKPEKPCDLGKSRIYILNAVTGKGAWTGNKKFIELEGVRMTGMVMSEDYVYAGVIKFPQLEVFIPDDLKVEEESASIHKGLLIFDVPLEVTNWESLYPEGVMVPSYWRSWKQ